MSEVAGVPSVLEGVGPRQAVVVRLLLRVLSTEWRSKVLDIVPRPPPGHTPLPCINLRVEDRLHALIVETASLCVWGGGGGGE